MSASAAQIAANRINAQISTGPRTESGKEKSRQNSYKHGLTGEGVVFSVEDAAEIQRRTLAFEEELRPSGEISDALVRRAAFLSVRLDRAMLHDTDAVEQRVQKAKAEFVAPEGTSAADAAWMRVEAGRRAMFDTSRESILARKYEAAAERGLYRALKELRQVEKAAKAEFPPLSEEILEGMMGSILQNDRELDALIAKSEKPIHRPTFLPGDCPQPTYTPPTPGGIDVPFAIGKRR
jgi:hypothetical protein